MSSGHLKPGLISAHICSLDRTASNTRKHFTNMTAHHLFFEAVIHMTLTGFSTHIKRIKKREHTCKLFIHVFPQEVMSLFTGHVIVGMNHFFFIIEITSHFAWSQITVILVFFTFYEYFELPLYFIFAVFMFILVYIFISRFYYLFVIFHLGLICFLFCFSFYVYPVNNLVP